MVQSDVLALVGSVFRLVRAVVEAALEQLDCDDGEDELEQHVDDHDVHHVLERVHHAVKHRLRPPTFPLVPVSVHGCLTVSRH